MLAQNECLHGSNVLTCNSNHLGINQWTSHPATYQEFIASYDGIDLLKFRKGFEFEPQSRHLGIRAR